MGKYAVSRKSRFVPISPIMVGDSFHCDVRFCDAIFIDYPCFLSFLHTYTHRLSSLTITQLCCLLGLQDVRPSQECESSCVIWELSFL